MRVKADLRKLHNLAETMRSRVTASRQQRDGRSWYRIENAVGASSDIYIYDMIGEWGITAQDFVGELKGVRAQRLDVHINSEGGEVFDGLAIYEALRQHDAEVTVYVDGIAASAASFIAMAGDKIVMAERARLMIHDAHGFAMGNANDMREMALLLDDLSDNIADVYAERAGGTRAEWRAAMHGPAKASDGTWYDAQAAVDAGLADEIATSKRGSKTDAGADGSVDISAVGSSQREVLDVATGEVTQTPWSVGAFLDVLRAAENPEPPVEIPDGRALIAAFRSA